MKRTIAFLLLVVGLAACGQKGDLYLPDPPPEQSEEESEEDEASE